MEKLFNRNEISYLTNNDAEDIRIILCKNRESVFKHDIKLLCNIISFSIKGARNISVYGKRKVINENEFVMLASGVNLICERYRGKEGYFEGAYIMFNNKALNDFLLKYPEFQRQNKSHSDYLNKYYVHQKDSFIDEYFLPSLEYILDEKDIPENIGTVKFEEIILYMCSKYPETITWINNILSRDEVSIQRIVEANLYQNVSVRELAVLCNLSISTFKRHFIRIYGESPQKYLIKKKMEHALFLLKEGDGNDHIKIYGKLGYNTMPAFTKSFKKYYGINLSEYRNILIR